MGQAKEQKQVTAERVADESYDVTDYQSADPVSRGLALTHEQVSDSYMEGTIDGRMDEYGGEENVQIRREGYEGMFP